MWPVAGKNDLPILRIQPRFRNLIQKYLTKTKLNAFWLFQFIRFG